MLMTEIRFYMAIFMRRIPIFIVMVLLLTAIAGYVALRAPTVYRADALLLFESAAIPDDLATSTVQTDPLEQIEIMEQRLMTRENLLDIADKFNVFDDQNELFPDQIVNRMRSATTFDTSSGRNRATLIEIEFNAVRANVAAQVANEYVTRLMAENVELRTDRAGDTMEFFRAEVEELGVDLDRASQRILEYKNANLAALPDSLDFRLARQSALREREIQIRREIANYNEQKDRLRQIFEATGGIGQGVVDNRSDEEVQLEALRDELTNALAIYSEQNPRVRLLQSRIAALERVVAQQLGAVGEDGAAPNPTAVLDLQIDEIDRFIAALDQEGAEITAELVTLEASIERTPTIAITVEALQREHDNLQSRYNAALNRLATAETGERIETLSKGQRISILRQPVVPREPAGPGKPMIVAGGMALGMALGVGLITVLEVFNRSIRRPADLTRGLGIAPLVTLPYSHTPGQITRRRTFWIALFLLVLLAIPAALFAVHQYYLPLDVLIERVISL